LPLGAPREITVVEADLRVPGSVAAPGDLHRAPPADRPVPGSGLTMESGFPAQYLLDARCGIEWLGQVNDVWWRTDLPAGQSESVPPEWQQAVDANGSIELTILLRLADDPEVTDGVPRIDATANGHTILYHPMTDPGLDC